MNIIAAEKPSDFKAGLSAAFQRQDLLAVSSKSEFLPRIAISVYARSFLFAKQYQEIELERR